MDIAVVSKHALHMYIHVNIRVVMMDFSSPDPSQVESMSEIRQIQTIIFCLSRCLYTKEDRIGIQIAE